MDLSGRISLERPIGDVFAAWSALDEAPRYATGVVERQRLTQGRMAVGTRFRAVDRWGPKTFDYTIEVTAFDAPTRMAVLFTEPLAGGWDAMLEEVGGETELRFEATLDPSGIPGVLQGLLRPWATRHVERYLLEFRTHFEAGWADSPRR